MSLTAEELSFIRASTTDDAAFARIVEMFDARQKSAETLDSRLGLYRQMAHRFPNGALYIVDHDLRYLVADGAAMNELGLSREMLEGRTCFEVFPADTVAMIEPVYRSALNGKTVSMEMPYSGRLFQTHAVPLFNESGDVMAALLMTEDITRQKELERQLVEQNKLLADMHQITIDMLNRRETNELLRYVIDSVITITDSSYAEVSLLEGDSMVLKAVSANLFPVIGTRPTRDEATVMWKAFDTREAVVLDNYQDLPAKRPVYDRVPLYAIAELPILIGTGCVGIVSLARTQPNYPYAKEQIERGMMLSRLVGLIYENARLYNEAIHELAERKRFEQRVVELAAENKRADVLSNFIRNASHEFRTPLSVIQTSLYLMNRASDPELKARKLAQIEEQISRINHLVDMLVAQSVLDSTATLQKQLISVYTLVHACIDSFEASLAKHQLTLKLELDEGLPPINGDGERLMEAINQILDNAVRYTPPGGTITIRGHYEKSRVIIAISDSGIGIPAEDLPHIFERFFRRDRAHTTAGFGLGLSIANKIVELHSGRIEVESIENTGTTFRIIVPV